MNDSPVALATEKEQPMERIWTPTFERFESDENGHRFVNHVVETVHPVRIRSACGSDQYTNAGIPLTWRWVSRDDTDVCRGCRDAVWKQWSGS